MNYENYEIADLPPRVSLENSNVDTDAGTFTLTLLAEDPISTTDTVTFTVRRVNTGSQAGPLDVDFVREDTDGTGTATFDVGSGTENDGKAGDNVVATGGSTYDGGQGFEFTIQNQNDQSATITNISISVSDSSVKYLSEQSRGTGSKYVHEAYISAATDGFVDRPNENYDDRTVSDEPSGLKRAGISESL